MTRQEVQHCLGNVTDRTVRRLAQRGVIERVALSYRVVRYTRRSVLALIDPRGDCGDPVNENDGAGGAIDPTEDESPAAAEATRLSATSDGQVRDAQAA